MQLLGIENINNASKSLSVSFVLGVRLLSNSASEQNRFIAEENTIKRHIAHLLQYFKESTAIVFIESNADHRWPSILQRNLTHAFGTRVKFACSWKDPRQKSIGIHTGESEKTVAAYYVNDLLKSNMIVYWDKFFSTAFSEPGMTHKEFQIAQLIQLNFVPRGSNKFEDPVASVSGKDGAEQDDVAIATILGLMWAALFRFNPVTMRAFGIRVANVRLRPPSEIIQQKILTDWRRLQPGEIDPHESRI